MLNGWQRLWVVIGLIFLLLTGLLLIEDIPTQEKVYRSWANETIEHTLKLEEFKSLSLWQVRSKYSDYSDQVIIEKIQYKFGAKDGEYALDFSAINTNHQSQLNNLFQNQIKSVGKYLDIWAIVMGVIYVLGWLVGWVIRGFKGNAP